MSGFANIFNQFRFIFVVVVVVGIDEIVRNKRKVWRDNLACGHVKLKCGSKIGEPGKLNQQPF